MSTAMQIWVLCIGKYETASEITVCSVLWADMNAKQYGRYETSEIRHSLFCIASGQIWMLHSSIWWWWWWWWLFPRLRWVGEKVGASDPRLHLFVCCKVEISSRTLIPHFIPGSVHSGSASWDDCGRMFAEKFCMSPFPDRFSHYAWTAA